jgi:hypothetical protein
VALLKACGVTGIPISNEDAARLREHFTTAGRTITTLAAALEQVFDAIRQDHEDRGGRAGWEFARGR